MTVISARRFAWRLRRRSPTERAAFVADLYAARGHETTHEGRRVRVRAGDEEWTLLAVRGFRPSAPEGPADAVLAPWPSWSVGARRLAAAHDAALVGPDDLRAMLQYAVSRETADRLCRAHLGRQFTRRGGWLGERFDVSPRTALVVLVAAALVVAGTVAAAGVPSFGEDAAGVDRAPAGVGVGAPDGSDLTGTQDVPDNNFPSENTPLPPGVSDSGVTDVDVLAAAHAEAVSGRVYRMVVEHRGTRSAPVPVGRPDPVVGAIQWHYANVTEIARVAAPDTYHYTATGRRGESSPASFAHGVYADGEWTYSREQTLSGVTYWRQAVKDDDIGIHAVRGKRYVARYLATDESSVRREVVEGETLYRIVATGVPQRLSRAGMRYRAVALVTPEGLVRDLNVSFAALNAEDATTGDFSEVRFRFTYDQFGAQTVFPPSWVEPARERLSGTDSEDDLPLHYPPGIGLTGMLDASALAEAHERGANVRNYRWTVTHNGSESAARLPLGRSVALLGSGADRYAEATAVARVVGPTEFRYSVDGRTATGSGPPARVEFDVYANGTHVFRRDVGNETVSYQRHIVGTDPTGSEVLAARAGRYIERYLSDRRAHVEAVRVEGVRHYRVRIPATPTDLGGADYYATALVTETGFVRTLRVETTHEERPVRFGFAYEPLRNGSLPPPAWLPEARNHTSGSQNVSTSGTKSGQRGPPSEDWLT